MYNLQSYNYLQYYYYIDSIYYNLFYFYNSVTSETPIQHIYVLFEMVRLSAIYVVQADGMVRRNSVWTTSLSRSTSFRPSIGLGGGDSVLKGAINVGENQQIHLPPSPKVNTEGNLPGRLLGVITKRGLLDKLRK